jgi:hypothetical protein
MLSFPNLICLFLIRTLVAVEQYIMCSALFLLRFSGCFKVKVSISSFKKRYCIVTNML